MKTIYKYGLSVTTPVILMPEYAIIRHIGYQDLGELTSPCQIQLWAEVDMENPPETRKFIVIATGEIVPDYAQYLGSTQAGPYIWHVYEPLR